MNFPRYRILFCREGSYDIEDANVEVGKWIITYYSTMQGVTRQSHTVREHCRSVQGALMVVVVASLQKKKR